MNSKKILGWVAVGTFGLTLLACSGSPGEGTKRGGEGVAVPSDNNNRTDEPGDSDPVIAKLGSKGLAFDAEKIDVTLSKPGTYKPGAYMPRVPKGQVAFTLTVTLVNRNDKAIKPSMLYFTASVGKDAAEAEQVFDTDAGLKGTPDTALLPGKQVKFKIGFQAPTTEANPVINVNVTAWELGGATGLFQGSLKG